MDDKEYICKCGEQVWTGPKEPAVCDACSICGTNYLKEPAPAHIYRIRKSERYVTQESGYRTRVVEQIRVCERENCYHVKGSD